MGHEFRDKDVCLDRPWRVGVQREWKWLRLRLWLWLWAWFWSVLLAGCASHPRVQLPRDSNELADVSLPTSLPAPREGSDVKDGVASSEDRPGQERLTPGGVSQPRSDHRLRSEVLSSIVDDPAIDPFQFRFRVEEGRVTVFGAGSARQKKRVHETVQRVRGVRSVESAAASVTQSEAECVRQNQTVTGSPSGSIFINDEELERQLQESIRRDIHSDFSIIEIRVSEGRVFLAGYVPNFRTKMAIEERAGLMPGVKNVMSRLQVKPARARTDERLRRDVRAAFHLEPLLDADDIQVQVHQGVVELAGEVSSAWKKQAVTRMCGQIWGVMEIRNRLHIAVFPRSSSAVERPSG